MKVITQVSLSFLPSHSSPLSFSPASLASSQESLIGSKPFPYTAPLPEPAFKMLVLTLDQENKPMVTKGKGDWGRGKLEEFGTGLIQMTIYTIDKQQGPTVHLRNYVQYSIINHNGEKNIYLLSTYHLSIIYLYIYLSIISLPGYLSTIYQPMYLYLSSIIYLSTYQLSIYL